MSLLGLMLLMCLLVLDGLLQTVKFLLQQMLEDRAILYFIRKPMEN